MAEIPQKKCDDCNNMFDNDHVFKCESCHDINTCIDCVGSLPRVGGGKPYDTLCKKCWQKRGDLIEQAIAKGGGK